MVDATLIEHTDPEVADLILRDVHRQNTHLHFIASENFVSRAVMEASGSVFTNKYAEGYPGRRYYEGCEVVDEVETLAIERANDLFGSEHANVQAHSGAQANMAVYFGLLEPGDKVLGMRLDQGGHLTHGSTVNFSGQLYEFIAYGVDAESEVIDMNQVRDLALEHRPKIVLAGYSAYSRTLDYSDFRDIAGEIDAVFMVDAAHFIGLVAGRAYPNPVPEADIVTATTHKALRGPRGGLILSKEEYGEMIDKAVFPDAQGGALFNQIAAKAVCFGEAATQEFRDYAAQVVRNAQALAESLSDNGLRVISGGTDNHLVLADVRSVDDELTGKEAASLLDDLGITLNRNAIPFDPRSPFVTSGIRFGTPAATTQGMREEQMTRVGELVMRALRHRREPAETGLVAAEVAKLAAEYPPYPPDFSGHV